MPNTEKMSRLNIEIPQRLHRQMKALASMRGQSLKDYVIEKVTTEETEYDLEDINDSLRESLQEVADHKAGKTVLPTYEQFIAKLNDR